MSLRSLLRQTCDLERATPTVAADGAVDLTWSSVAEEVPCALHHLDSETELISPGEMLHAGALLFVPAGTDIEPCRTDGHADRAVVGGETWLVVGVTDDVVGGNRFRVATLSRVA